MKKFLYLTIAFLPVSLFASQFSNEDEKEDIVEENNINEDYGNLIGGYIHKYYNKPMYFKINNIILMYYRGSREENSSAFGSDETEFDVPFPRELGIKSLVKKLQAPNRTLSIDALKYVNKIMLPEEKKKELFQSLRNSSRAEELTFNLFKMIDEVSELLISKKFPNEERLMVKEIIKKYGDYFIKIAKEVTAAKFDFYDHNLNNEKSLNDLMNLTKNTTIHSDSLLEEHISLYVAKEEEIVDLKSQVKRLEAQVYNYKKQATEAKNEAKGILTDVLINITEIESLVFSKDKTEDFKWAVNDDSENWKVIKKDEVKIIFNKDNLRNRVKKITNILNFYPNL